MKKKDNKSGKLEICNDSAIDNARLFKFNEYAKTFEEIITNPENETPFSIVINGRWGCGKTSLMKTLREQIKENSGKGDKRKIQTVWFNAWKYSDTDQLLASLVRELFAEMKLYKKRKFWILNYFERVDVIRQASDLISILTAGKGPDIAKWKKIPEYEKNLPFYDNFREYLNKSFSFFELDDKSGAMVIFIDDLDRCSPKAVTKVLETINLFFDKPGCIFVLGMDMGFITMAIENHYKDFEGFSGKEYLDKMIQMRFDLPYIPDSIFLDFIEENLQNSKLEKKSFDLILRTTGSNPRKCKQFINSLKLMISLGNNSTDIRIDNDLLVKWLSLNYRFPKFTEGIKIQPDLIDIFQEHSLKGQKELEKWCEDEDKTNDTVQYQKGIIKKYIGEAALFEELKEEKKFNIEGEPATNIDYYVYLSAVSPLNDKPRFNIIEAEIDKGPYIDRINTRIEGSLKPNNRHYFFYHFKVPEGTPEWDTYFSSSFLVNGEVVKEGKFLPRNLNGEDYGMYEYKFPEEGKYEIEIRGTNSVKATVEVGTRTASIPKDKVIIYTENQNKSLYERKDEKKNSSNEE